MKRRAFFILCAVILYIVVFLCHDNIFLKKNYVFKPLKTANLITNSNEGSDSANTYISDHHKCPFCDGFENNADIQEILRVDLFKEKIYNESILLYISTRISNNLTRAPPTL
jgi:hypothetical protein